MSNSRRGKKKKQRKALETAKSRELDSELRRESRGFVAAFPQGLKLGSDKLQLSKKLKLEREAKFELEQEVKLKLEREAKFELEQEVKLKLEREAKLNRLKREIKDEILNQEILNQKNVITKSIEFNAAQFQAGMSILAYFGEIVKSKHPETSVKISVEQNGNIVSLHVLTKDGYKKIIERTLDEYALVVSERAPIATLFDSKMQIMALESKLEMAKLEVRLTRDMLGLANDSSRTLEDEVKNLRYIVGGMTKQTHHVNKLLGKQITDSKSERKKQNNLLAAVIERFAPDSDGANKQLLKTVTLINQRFNDEIKPEDEYVVKEAILLIKTDYPSIYNEIKAALLNTTYGVMGNATFTSIMTLFR